MDLLDNPVHRDAWGSTTAIPRLLGEVPDGEPRSELWMGAHPDAPSRLQRAGDVRTLVEVIDADPVSELGSAVVDTHGPRLPFLLKVLAAARPLSLQAHPDGAQAAAGYAAEEQRGISPDDPARNYRDASHKPEMLCALSEFHALCGFRPVDETIALLDTLDVAALAGDLATLQARPDARGVRSVLDRLLHLSAGERASLVDAVAGRCADLAGGDGRDARLAETVVEVAAQHPGDVGVVCALLMNRVALQPGEAIFLAAGNLHAYLHGVGVEVMANSDNVLRGGLTVRHVDVDELMAIIDVTPGPVPLVRPVVRSDVEVVYPVPVPDFELTRLTLTSGRSHHLASGRPQILLVVTGALEVRQAGETQRVTQGQAGFFPATDPPAVLTGVGTAFAASTPIEMPGEAPEVGAAG